MKMVVYRKGDMWFAQLQVSRDNGTALAIVTSAVPLDPTPGAKFRRLSFWADPPSFLSQPEYAIVFPAAGPKSDQTLDPNLADFRFALPKGTVKVTSSGIRARLPVLAGNEGTGGSGPTFGSIGPATDTNVADLYPVIVPADKPLRTLFWPPTNPDTTEAIADVGEQILKSDLETDFPQNGGVMLDSFEWQNTNELAPELSAIDRSVRGRHDRDEFYSGLAFAISATAFVALIQETPDKWRRRHKTASESANAVAPHQNAHPQGKPQRRIDPGTSS
ncbi:MAG: hypothetical protein ACJ74U_03590 [Jatrophihabitantaceae bacterium]